MSSQRSIVILRAAADGSAMLAAFAAAYVLRQWEPIQAFRFPIQPLAFYLPLLPPALLVLLGIFWRQGLYHAPARGLSITDLVRMARGSALWVLVLMAASYVFRTDPSRALLILTGLLTLPAAPLARAALYATEERLFRSAARRLIVIGSAQYQGHILPSTFENQLFELVARIDTESGPALLSLRDLPELLRTTGATDVLISDLALPRDEILNAVAAAEAYDVRFRVAPTFFPLLPDRGVPFLLLDLASPRRGLWVRGGKRALDLAWSAALLPVAIPLGLLIALVIRLDSKGPALFSHQRVGAHGRPFRMLKFRTMRAGTPAIADSPRSPDDARITGAGRWLRRWSLDELPQLWNVLQGDMSLVGPRPEMPHLVAEYAPWQRIRLRVRPGLTGLWQVLGRKEFPLHEHLEYDVYYVNNVCASLDLAILLKTVPRIIGGRGAF